MNKELIKTGVLVLGTFTVAVCANMVANALYQKSIVGVDKKRALLAGAVGLATVFFVAKKYHKSC
jgi:uncharacterized membrane protein